MEDDASQEITEILSIFGDNDPHIRHTNYSGILTAKTSLDPFVIVKEIRKKIIDEPWSIRYCMRIIPIQIYTITNNNAIVDSIFKICKMNTNETYRITIEKRNSDISSKELITEIAKKIPNKVSLVNFDWIILLEILGNETGISILKENDIIRTQKIKRSLSEE